jgi:sulfite exporter TauE/SafE
MDTSFFAAIFIGFLLGIKHAMEPDHLIAVSTIASNSKNLWKSALTGVYWGLGHTLTLLIVGTLLIVMKIELSTKWALSLEFLVGVMLVYLGLTSFFTWKGKKIHHHDHDHGGYKHNHFHDVHRHEHLDFSFQKSIFIGMIHGLAGSAAMVVLTMATVSTVWGALLYIGLFGLGTVAGMMLFTTIIGIPFAYSATHIRLNVVLIRFTGLTSAIFGFYYMYNLGINEDLFHLWIQ